MKNITLTMSDFFSYGLIGATLALLYMFLLWQTISIIKQSKHKNLILFISATLRIFLLIFIALVFSNQNTGIFIIIMCGFLLMRAILIKLSRPSLKKKLTSSELLYAENKKTFSKTRRNTKSRKKKY